MSVRWLLSLLIATWTLASVARLVFDLIGNLWLVVVFDFVQIVFLISGLFGATQKRRPLLYTLLLSNALSVAVNVLIFLWYIGIFGEISRPWLSAGLPYSSSFFLRFTPYCSSEFDVIRKKWVQKNCLVPFYSIEASQAILHVIFSVVTAIFSIIVLLETRKKPPGSSAQSINHYAQISASKVTKAPSSTNGSSSGYVNSTYDDLRSQGSARVVVDKEREREPKKGQFSKKKSKKKERRPSMPAPDCAPCSSTKSSEEEDVYTQPIKKKPLTLRRPDLEEENRPTTVTSLVSFDPKSATLLRIRQHLEAEPSDREQTPDYEPHDLYERLRSRSSGSDLAPASTIPLSSDYKSRNTSQDSVPSMFAPMLDSPAPSSTSSSAGGIQLSKTPMSPGIRLSEQLGAAGARPAYKSAFRVQQKESRVIGHYHAANEIPLSSDPSVAEEPTNYPVMTSGGLLV